MMCVARIPLNSGGVLPIQNELTNNMDQFISWTNIPNSK